MKRLVAVLLVLCVGAVAFLWFVRPRLAGALHSFVEGAIAQAIKVPTRVEDIQFSFFPLRVTARELVVGAAEPFAKVSAIDVELEAGASLVALQPVLKVTVGEVDVDLLHLPPRHAAPSEKAAPNALPALQVESLDVGPIHMRFPMDHTHGDLQIEHVTGALQTAPVGWGGDGTLVVSNIELRRREHRVEVYEARLEGGLDDGGLFVRDATVNGEGINARVIAGLGSRRYAATADFDPSLLGVVVDELAFIHGSAKVEGTLEGDLANPIFRGQLALEGGAIADRAVGDLTTGVLRDGTILRFDPVEMRGVRGGRVIGTVGLDIYKEVPIDSELQWEGVDLEGLLRTIGVDVPFRTRTNATTTLRGRLDPLDLDISGGGTFHDAATAAGSEIARWQVSARVRPDNLDTRLDVSQGQNRLLGGFTLIDNRLGGAVNLSAPDLAGLSALLPAPVIALSLTGYAEGTAEFAGTTKDPSFGGRFLFRRLTVSGTKVPEASGDFAITKTGLTTTRTSIDTPAGRATLVGTVAIDDETRNDWTLTLEDLNTDLLLSMAQGFLDVRTPVNGGTLAGTLHCEGRWREAELRADIGGRWIRIGTEPLESITGQFNARLPNWTLRLGIDRVKGETLSIDASGRDVERVDLVIDSTPIKLARRQEGGVKGTLSLRGRLSGEPPLLDGSLEAAVSDLSFDGRPLGDGWLTATARRGDWTVSGSALGDRLQISGSVAATTRHPYTVNIRWADADFAALLSSDESLRVVSTGGLNLSGTLVDVTRPNGELSATRLEIGADKYQLSAVEPIRVSIDNGTFRVRSFSLEAPGGRLAVSGTWTLVGDVSLDVEGGGDLALMEILNDRVESAGGSYEIAGQVRHASGALWQLGGRATMHDARFDFGLPVELSATNGSVVFSGSRLLIERLEGKAGGGEFSLAGDVDVNQGPNVTWAAREVALNLPDWLEEKVSGSGRVSGSWEAITVSGAVEVLSALYDRDIAITDLFPWFQQRLAPAHARDTGRVIFLDLRVHAPGGLFVDNNFLKAELAADLRLSGVAQKPVLTGTIDILSGEVTFQRRVFTLTGGSIDFRDPFRINPILNISAESQISTSEGEYIIAATVTGTGERPRVQLSSDDPNLTQNDIVALVAAGRTSAQMQRESTGLQPGSVLSIVPTGWLEERVGSFIGVDTFEVGSERTQSTGTIVPEVTIGKNITDRLRATASSTLVESYQSVGLEYRLTRRLSLLGAWESQTKSQAGALEAGAKLRFEFRRTPFSLWRGP